MSMLEREELIQQGVNQAGQLATEYALSQFDTDGSPLTVNEKNKQARVKYPRPTRRLMVRFFCAVMFTRQMQAVALFVLWTTMPVLSQVRHRN